MIRLPASLLKSLKITKKSMGFKNNRQLIRYLLILHDLNAFAANHQKVTFDEWLTLNDWEECKGKSTRHLIEIVKKNYQPVAGIEVARDMVKIADLLEDIAAKKPLTDEQKIQGKSLLNEAVEQLTKLSNEESKQ